MLAPRSPSVVGRAVALSPTAQDVRRPRRRYSRRIGNCDPLSPANRLVRGFCRRSSVRFSRRRDPSAAPTASPQTPRPTRRRSRRPQPPVGTHAAALSSPSRCSAAPWLIVEIQPTRNSLGLRTSTPSGTASRRTRSPEGASALGVGDEPVVGFEFRYTTSGGARARSTGAARRPPRRSPRRGRAGAHREGRRSRDRAGSATLE